MSRTAEELLRKAQIEHDADFLREGVRVLSQALMELEVEEQSMSRKLWVWFLCCLESVHREIAPERPLLTAPQGYLRR